jgi:hypothetical protein
MDEEKLQELKPAHYLMIVTAFFYSSLVLFVRLNGNFSKNPLWPFIRFGCKWSLFAWIFYAGLIYGKKLSSKLIVSLQLKFENLELDLKKSRNKNDLLRDEIKEVQKNLDQEIERTRTIESTLHEKLKKYERTASEANRDALKNFV